MGAELRILVLEDDPTDAELIALELRRAGLSFDGRHAEDRASFAAALREFEPDVVLADYRLPSFTGRDALEMVRGWRADVPVIIVTGTLGDELAVELLKAGAQDYVLKDRLVRLGPAVRRALKEREVERDRRRAERALEKANRALRTLSAGNEAMLRAVDEASILRGACRAVVETGGYPDAWVGYARSDASFAIEPVAQIGFPGGALEGLRLTWREGDSGIAGAAIRTFSAQIGKANGGPEGAEPASLALPFAIDSTRGVLCIHAREAEAFDPEEVGVLKELVEDLGYGITSLRISADRVSAEQALHEGELRFRQIVETAQEGIWMLDAERRTTYVNRRMAEMMAAQAGEISGLAAEDIVDADSMGVFLQRLARLGEPDPVPERLECLLRRRDGSSFWATISMNAVEDASSRRLRYLAMVTDVTEHRRLQEQLVTSDRMAAVGTLAAGVAHEINNPLSSLLANLQLALEATGDEARLPGRAAAADLRESLRDALEAAERVRSIASDLKVFSRPREETTGPVDVEAVVESALRMARNEIRQRARVARDYQPVARVAGNESRLGQVFLNLIVNAAQSMEEGRAGENVITVAIRLDPRGRVVVEIRDTGCGMPPDVLRRLFRPFFTTKAQGVGTGLGLSICHRIVTAMGGEIAVESTVGRGSAFRVLLPPVAIEEQIVQRPPARASAAPHRRGRILVVDDEAIVGRAVARILAIEHEVTVETSGRQAMERIAGGQPFDVILCDLQMPEITGMDLHAEICRSRPELAGSIIFMTGGAFTPRARAFLDQIHGVCIEKPFDVAALKDVVNGHLRGREAS